MSSINPNILSSITENVEKVIYGKKEVIELVLCSFLSNGHTLIEDVPGVGKTSLASVLAKTFSCSYRRIQFTPDIMPSDITGFSMFNQKTGDFTYKEGAVMAQIILADEINRASPKAQSSLLEVMEEKQVTVDGRTYPLPKPFIVLATQNPFEYVGTYQLPEAQVDRFFMRVSIGYPTPETESGMLSMYDDGDPIDKIKPVASPEDLLRLQERVLKIHVDQKIKDYITAISNSTRTNENIRLGASPRASINLYRAAQAWALYKGRDYASPDDVIYMAEPVLAHRLSLSQEAKLKKMTAEAVIREVISSVKVPK